MYNNIYQLNRYCTDHKLLQISQTLNRPQTEKRFFKWQPARERDQIVKSKKEFRKKDRRSTVVRQFGVRVTLALIICFLHKSLLFFFYIIVCQKVQNCMIFILYNFISTPNSRLFDFLTRIIYFLQLLFKNIQNVIKDIFFYAIQNTKQVKLFIAF